MRRLADKVALITGGARGQGQAEAELFAREGARVAVADILDDQGAAVADVTGGLYVHLDVSSAAHWAAAVQAVLSRWGRLDILVNNAGIVDAGRILDLSEETWERVMDVNARGVLLGMQAVLPIMRAAGGGSIVNISSIVAFVGTRLSSAYPAAKAAVYGLTRTAAVQYGRDGVRVNSVHPGPVDTPMAAPLQSTERGKEEIRRQVPLGRVARPEEVAAAVLFLASDEASYVNGAALVVDGGWTAQ